MSEYGLGVGGRDTGVDVPVEFIMLDKLLLNPNILTRLFWFWGWLNEKLLNWLENVELAFEFALFWIGFGIDADKEDVGICEFVWEGEGQVEGEGVGIPTDEDADMDEDAWDVDVELLA